MKIVLEVADFADANAVINLATPQLLLDRQGEPLGQQHGETALVGCLSYLAMNFHILMQVMHNRKERGCVAL